MFWVASFTSPRQLIIFSTPRMPCVQTDTLEFISSPCHRDQALHTMYWVLSKLVSRTYQAAKDLASIESSYIVLRHCFACMQNNLLLSSHPPSVPSSLSPFLFLPLSLPPSSLPPYCLPKYRLALCTLTQPEMARPQRTPLPFLSFTPSNHETPLQQRMQDM